MFCGLFRRRHERPREVVAPVRHEPELYDADAANETYFGQVSTLAAEVRVGKNGKNSRRQVVRMTPFVGPFAGRRVVFVVEQSKTKVLVDSVKISTQLDLTHGGGGSLRDKCINFLHGSGRVEELQFAIPPPQPHSLQFLCKKHIILSGVLPPGTPMAEAAKFNSTTKQAVIVSVWPSSRRRAGELDGLKIRVPVHLSFGELACYVGEKLSLPDTCSVHFREPDGIYSLQPSRPLQLRHTELECFVKSPSHYCLTSPSPVLLPVMLVGSGMAEIVISPLATIVELEASIVQHFRLTERSFVYIPALFTPGLAQLKMFTNANRQAALALLHQQARQFPIVSDDDLTLRVDYHELPLYNMTLSEAGLLHDGPPLLCFNVTGPTVPLSFRAYCTSTAVGTTNSSGGSGSSTGFSNHMSVTAENRIISINPHWTASTLLKYIDCVSRFSCRKLLLKESVISHDRVIGKLFSREWIVANPNGRNTLSPNVLRVV